MTLPIGRIGPLASEMRGVLNGVNDLFHTVPTMRYPISNATLDAGDIAILGRKGSGKTYTAKGLVERLIRRGRRVIVIDPMSIWWGLCLAADGEKSGLPLVVIGGKHGDIPLLATPQAGTQVAKLPLALNVSAIIDVADCSPAARALRESHWRTHLDHPGGSSRCGHGVVSADGC